MERDDRFMAGLESVDAVIVNGEGTIHHGFGLALIAALHAAKRRGKATFLVNCLLEEVPLDAELLNAFDHLSVREVRSETYLRSLGVRCVRTFDSIVAAQFVDGVSDLRGKIVLTDWTAANHAEAGAISKNLLRSDVGPSCALFETHGERGGVDAWANAVAALAEARAVVSSRHHGLYLACLARTPFVALRGHTWKVEGLIETLGADLPVVANYGDLRRALDELDGRQAAFDLAFDRIAEARDLQHFGLLGRGDDSSERAEVARLWRDVEARPDLAAADSRNVRKRRAQEGEAKRKPLLSRLLKRFGRPKN